MPREQVSVGRERRTLTVSDFAERSGFSSCPFDFILKQPSAIEKILSHLGLLTESPKVHPARASPEQGEFGFLEWTKPLGTRSRELEGSDPRGELVGLDLG